MKEDLIRFWKSNRPVRKKDLKFVGIIPFYVIEKRTSSQRWGTGPVKNSSTSFYLTLESVDCRYKTELFVHPNDYYKYKRKRNQRNPKPIPVSVFHYKDTTDIYVSLLADERRGRNFICRQARIMWFIAFIVLLAISYMLSFFIWSFFF